MCALICAELNEGKGGLAREKESEFEETTRKDDTLVCLIFGICASRHSPLPVSSLFSVLTVYTISSYIHTYRNRYIDEWIFTCIFECIHGFIYILSSQASQSLANLVKLIHRNRFSLTHAMDTQTRLDLSFASRHSCGPFRPAHLRLYHPRTSATEKEPIPTAEPIFINLTNRRNNRARNEEKIMILEKKRKVEKNIVRPIHAASIEFSELCRIFLP